MPLLSNPSFARISGKINAPLKEAEAAQIEMVPMTANLNEPYNQYQWSIVPMLDQNQVIVIGEQELKRVVSVAYDFEKRKSWPLI